MQRLLNFLAALSIATILLPCSDSLGSENAVVIVNAESAASKLIANHYIQLRDIPLENVIYLSGVPQREVISIRDFRNKILTPIVTAISQRRLSRHVDYIIYSSDFPTIINAKPDAQKLMRNNNSDPNVAANSKLLNPFISITSATFYLTPILKKKVEYLSLTANTYARSTIGHLLTRPFVDESQKEFQRAMSLAKLEKFDPAIETLKSLADKNPLQIAVLYWLARTYAWQGDTENAIQWLKRSLAVGWAYRDYTMSDTAFAKLKGDPEFQKLVSIIPNYTARYGPTTSFRNSYIWGPNGMINSEENQGNRYILSAMLAVTRNQGNSEQQALNYLTRSVEADGTKPTGTFYFAKSGDIRTKTRSRGIDEAIVELQALGHNAEIFNGKVPQGKNDIAGLTIGAASFNWPVTNRILPGAICENLTSFGGRLLPGTKQTKLSEFLKHGAAGSSGTVIEPYAIQAKFPHPRVHVHYVRGCTLAEAFYQSVTGPFQLLIVGDPLCQPWADIPTIKLSGELNADNELKGDVTFDVTAEQAGRNVRLIEMYLDGRLVRKISGSATGNISVQTTTMPDGYHEFRFSAVANGTIQTRGSAIVPVMVNNYGQQVQLSANTAVARIDQEFEFTVNAPNAKEIAILHNRRELAQANSENANFTVPAHQFGRGPVVVEAIARFEKTLVRSRPLEIMIEGRIANSIPILKTPAKKPKSQKPASEKAK